MPTPHAVVFEEYLQFVMRKCKHLVLFKFAIQKRLPKAVKEFGSNVMRSYEEVLEELGLHGKKVLKFRFLGVHVNARTIRMPLLSFALCFMMHEKAMLFTMGMLNTKDALSTKDEMGRTALHWAMAVPCMQLKCDEPIEHSLFVINQLLQSYGTMHEGSVLGLSHALCERDNNYPNGLTPLQILIMEKHALRSIIGYRLVTLGAHLEPILPYLQHELLRTSRLITSAAAAWCVHDENTQEKAGILALGLKYQSKGLGLLSAELFCFIILGH